jgi:general stress protein 26
MSSTAEATKVREMIEGIRLAMLTTIDRSEERLVSRPMAVAQVEEDGTLWFLTDESSPKADDLEVDPAVNVSFSSDTTWVSVAGRGTVIDDKAKVHELWNPHAAAWFPDGPDAEHVGVLRVDPDSAEYWDSPGKARMALSYLKARATGTQPEAGDSGSVEL